MVKKSNIDRIREDLEPVVVSKTVRLNEMDFDRIQEICKEEGWSVSKLLRKLMSDFISDYEKQA